MINNGKRIEERYNDEWKKETNEIEELTTKVFVVMFAGCVLFILAAVLIGFYWINSEIYELLLNVDMKFFKKTTENISYTLDFADLSGLA